MFLPKVNFLNNVRFIRNKYSLFSNYTPPTQLSNDCVSLRFKKINVFLSYLKDFRLLFTFSAGFALSFLADSALKKKQLKVKLLLASLFIQVLTRLTSVVCLLRVSGFSKVFFNVLKLFSEVLSFKYLLFYSTVAYCSVKVKKIRRIKRKIRKKIYILN